jgi:hypothetical protein
MIPQCLDANICYIYRVASTAILFEVHIMSCCEEKQAAEVANTCHIDFPETESIVLTVSPLQHHHYPSNVL